MFIHKKILFFLFIGLGNCVSNEMIQSKELSSEEALFIIEILLDEIPFFIEKYKLGDEFSWKEWIKKYGIYTMLGTASLSLRIYVRWKRKHERMYCHDQNYNKPPYEYDRYDHHNNNTFIPTNHGWSERRSTKNSNLNP